MSAAHRSRKRLLVALGATGAGLVAAYLAYQRYADTGAAAEEETADALKLKDATEADITEAKASAAKAAEEAHSEVAAIKAAADLAHTTMIAEAKKEAGDAAKASAAKAAEEAQLEVAAIKAASYLARETMIAKAKKEAEDALAQAQKEATPLRPPVSKTKPLGLIPDGKHAFLSYQWDVQEQVMKIKNLLNEKQILCWMDIDGGMKNDIYDSMAEGLQSAACVICFMSQAYQDSANCKLELKFAQQSGVPIIPVMMQANFAAKGWLAILTAGSIWTPMHESGSVLDGVDNLIIQVQHVVPHMRSQDDASDAASEASDATESFDVAAWGDAMFSLDETREELERLRKETVPSGGASKQQSIAGDTGLPLCSLPAIVPPLPRGLFVTAEMQSVLDAVLSNDTMHQIGFCGMGGIGTYETRGTEQPYQCHLKVALLWTVVLMFFI